MRFEYSEDEKILQTSIKNFLRDKYPINKVREWTITQKIDNNLLEMLKEQGLLGLIVEEDENIESNLIYSLLISYESGRALLPFPIIEGQIVSYFLNKVGKKNLIEKQYVGEKIYTIGWNTSQLNYKKGNITGTVTFVPFAESCDYMMICYESADFKDKAILVNLHDQAVQIEKVNSMDQTYPIYKVKLKEYIFNKDDVIIYKDIRNIVQNIGIFLNSAENIGGCEEMLSRTVEYTKERIQFKQPIARFQAVKHKAADMYLLLESSRVALKYAAWTISTNKVDKLETTIPVLKSYVSAATKEIAGLAIQLHGGVGFTWESDLHMYFKRIYRNADYIGNKYELNERLFNQIKLKSIKFEKEKSL